MFNLNGKNWPLQDYGNPKKTYALPGGATTKFEYATDVASGPYLRRRETRDVLESQGMISEHGLHDNLAANGAIYESFADAPTKPLSTHAQATSLAESKEMSLNNDLATSHQRPVVEVAGAVETARPHGDHLRRHRHHGRA
jgi:hypothetical protein